MTLATPMPGERLQFAPGVVGSALGSGPPLLLVHSVNAAASAAEVRPLYMHCAATHTVFAHRPAGLWPVRPQRPRLHAAADDRRAARRVGAVIRQRCGAAPVDALAVSLGCEFLARAAAEQPAHWGRLALVSPTGFMGRKVWRGRAGQHARACPGCTSTLTRPLWAQALFNGLTRPGVVRYFLQRTWGGKTIDETMWADAVATARAPGARHAPLHFLAADLFSADIHTVYEAAARSRCG